MERIFFEYLSGIGIFAIAQRLTADEIPCPSAYDPQRNRHRSGIAWSKRAVRVALTNPRYTGHQVWNRQSKDESLIDVEDVALGHETTLKWNPKEAWIFSEQQAHPALVSQPTFADHALLRLQGRAVPQDLRPADAGQLEQRQSVLPLPLPQRVRRGEQDRPPLTVYLREDAIADPLDAWNATANSPGAAPPWRQGQTRRSSPPGAARCRPSGRQPRPRSPESISHAGPPGA
ncbi:recombinase family protein [Streptomyces sp.]